MHLVRLGAVLCLATALASCAPPGLSCRDYGLAGSLELQRCEAAHAARQEAAQRGAVDTVRSLGAMQPLR